MRSLLFSLTAMVFSPFHLLGNANEDTITIDFGNNSRIVILVNNQEDLAFLQQYDINKMLSDLSLSIDTADYDVTNLKIEDKTGARYLKDTTLVASEEGHVENKRSVDDIESLSDIRDRIKEKSSKHKRTHRASRGSMNLELGKNNYLQDGSFPEDDAFHSVKPWGSWYVAINSSHKFNLLGPLSIDWGKGISWYNFKFQNPDARLVRMDHGAGFMEDPLGLANIRSKVTVSHLNMSLVPLLDFGRSTRALSRRSHDRFSFSHLASSGFRIGAGGYTGYRVGSYTKYVFRDERRQNVKERGSFYLNNWRYGIRGQMGIGGFDMFFNYDLSPLYRGADSPNLQPFSFGVIF
jgi:hypothetical protein